MKISRPSRPDEYFGCCHTTESLLKYLKDEGWITIYALCDMCGHRWTMVINPAKLPKITTKKDMFNLPEQPCKKCNSLSVRASLKHFK